MKKKLITGLSLASLTALAIGGSLALLTSEDSQENTFTLGQAKITQNEYTSNSIFENGKLLLPTMKQDKIVKVTNTGTINVYYRTVIAVEAPEAIINGIKIEQNKDSDIVWSEVDGISTINGVDYQLYVATYKTALAPKQESKASLLAVEMAEHVTNETIAAYGEEVDVIVLSQAVQTNIVGCDTAEESLNYAFGEITAGINPWTETKSVNSQEALTEAIKNAEGPVIVNIEQKGTYNLPAIKNKEVVIKGTEDTVINMVNIHTGQETTGADITFDGVTVKFDNKADFKGFAHTKRVVYKNSTLIGKQVMYAPEVEFVNCVFENSDDYAVWTYGSSNVKFTDCTFNSGGKAVLVYKEGEIHANLEFENCTFNDNGTLDTKKAAIEVGSSPQSANTTYDITINDCEVNGFAINDEGTSTGSTYWGNKNSMDQDHLKVTINNKVVYGNKN